MDESDAVDRYVYVIGAFVTGRITPDRFEQEFIQVRREVAGQGVYPSGEAGEVLDDLFGDVDAYTTLEPRGDDELDAASLLAAAKRAQERLADLR